MFGCSNSKGLEAVSITHNSPNSRFVGDFMKKIKARAQPKPAIFMDNASWNKAVKVQRICDSKGMPIIFNRPYFPQGNSVELFNAWVVDKFKRSLLDNFLNDRKLDGPTLLQNALDKVDQAKVMRTMEHGLNFWRSNRFYARAGRRRRQPSGAGSTVDFNRTMLE